MQKQFKFTRPLEYELKDNGDLIISLDISTTEKDLVNDIVTPNFLKSMQKQIQDRNLKLDIEHESFRGNTLEEKEINKTKIPAGRMMNPTIKAYKNEKGEIHHRLNVKALINKFREDFENIKGNIVNKFLDAASIAFIPTKSKKIGDARVLDDGVLLNTALTGNAINTGAQLREIVSKSINSLEEYKSARDKDPEIEKDLVIKATSPQSRRTQARNEAISEDDDEEEKTGKKKKKVYKAYEKDGAHAHTDDEPLGLHNHPEIENIMRMNFEIINDRINSLREPKAEETSSFKSHSSPKGNDLIKLTEKEMESENIQKKDEAVKPDESTPKSDESAPAETPAEKVEQKAEMKSLSEKVEAFETDMKSMKGSLNKIAEALNKTVSGAVEETKNHVPEVNGPKLTSVMQLI